MSNLTKILVVLLSLSCVFLSGSVMTYIGNNVNYKAKYDTAVNDMKAMSSTLAMQSAQNSEKQTEYMLKETELSDEKANLLAQITSLQVAVQEAKTSNLKLENQNKNFSDAINGFEQTVSNMTQSLELNQNELVSARKASTDAITKLNEVTLALQQKNVQLNALESERRRLLEDKAQLEETLAKATGIKAQTSPVTIQDQTAKPAATATPSSVTINGLVKQVFDSMIELSIGSADGISAGMKLHVTRGDKFICDVEITNVDTDRSAGTISLIQDKPKVGDNVTTKI